MKRERRSDLIRRTHVYHAKLIEAMVDNSDGIYELGATDEEHNLVVATTLRIADSIRARGGYKRKRQVAWRHR